MRAHSFVSLLGQGLVTAAAGLAVSPPAAAHDLFLELPAHRLAPRASTAVALVNGTFGRSDNTIARDRMLDVSLVGPADEVVHPPVDAWRDEGTTSWLDVTTGDPGTYVLGVSTAPRVIELSAKDFHEYLRHDGVLDVLQQRRRAGLLGQPARERYSKHVKAVLQVGDERSDAHGAALGYPIEIVPLRHPDRLLPGDELPLSVLLDGAPLASQLVYASHADFHGHDASGAHVEAFSGRTDESGRVTLPVGSPGRWYVRLIHMTPSPEPDVDYESLWATLTFEVHERPPAGAGAIVAAIALTLGFVVLVVGVAGRRLGAPASR